MVMMQIYAGNGLSINAYIQWFCVHFIRSSSAISRDALFNAMMLGWTFIFYIIAHKKKKNI